MNNSRPKNSKNPTINPAIKQATQKVKKVKLADAKLRAENIKYANVKNRNTKKLRTVPASVIIKKKSAGSISNFIVAMYMVLVLLNSKNNGKPLRKFTKKEADELIKKVTASLKIKLSASSDNLYKVNLGFLTLGRAEFKNFIDNVINRISVSSVFTSPVPSLTDLNGMIALEAAARSTGKTNTANKYLKTIKNMMRKLCVYIADNCDNDMDTILSVGVRANKLVRGAHVKASRAKIIKVKDTKKSGQAKVTVEKVDGMQGLMGRYMLKDVDGAQWIIVNFSLGITILFIGMPKGKEVLLQVCFKAGEEEFGDWSESMEWVVR